MSITDLPPFQYDLSSPDITLSRSERNRIIRQDLLQIHVRETWIAPREPLPTKRQHYREHFLTVTADGFIQRPQYMDTYMAPAERVAIGQLRVSSHQLEIEIGRATHTPRDERLCRICREEVEDEEHYTCRCQAYEDIRDRYPQLFRGPREIRALLGTEDQRPLGRFLVELQHHRASLLQQRMEIHLPPPPPPPPQTYITDFFRPTYTRGPSSMRGVTLHRAEELRRHRRRPRPLVRRARPHQREIQAIHARHDMEIQRRQQCTPIDLDTQSILRIAMMPYPPMHYILHPLQAFRGL
ncbi:hypothetical protein KP509_16G002600 [Ceratopteris richardii]|uniref:Uncharacterized protein n=1 Tax=Ceratopteris richardii TaxID=49495 RepID=A0A8T2SXQ1_CERRI|nr:hypothetical protein KP509_16G002600 [Ceratopteris richardii]